jgi:FkbM family methyltransferase
VLITTRFKDLVADQLSETRAYGPLREVYRTLFNRDYFRVARAMQEFYGQFVKPESLVFDIGANRGAHAEIFLGLGAHVVAVEPNPACCKRMRTLERKGRLTIRCEAVGDREGQATLFTGAHDGHSTISEEWMKTASTNDPGFRWDGSINVRLNTLDAMQRQYGTPAFIKIDIEGYEASALRGIHFRPAAIGFEFHSFSVARVRECLSLPVFDLKCCFNLVVGDDWQFVWHDWRDKAAVLNYISSLPATVFGDIYAKFDAPELEPKPLLVPARGDSHAPALTALDYDKHLGDD